MSGSACVCDGVCICECLGVRVSVTPCVFVSAGGSGSACICEGACICECVCPLSALTRLSRSRARTYTHTVTQLKIIILSFEHRQKGVMHEFKQIQLQ